MPVRPTALPAFAVFAVAARHQNLARAAEELGLTASAVSHHVRGLEGQLGVKLFQRHARGVALTAEGRSLADAASLALSELDLVARALKSVSSDVERIRVAALHSWTYCWLLPRVPRFLSTHPQARLSFETSTAIARFDHTGPDIAIRHGAGSWAGMTAHHLMDEMLFPVGPPGLPGLSAIHSAAEIAHLPLITDLAHQGWREWFQAAGVRGVTLPEMHSFTDSTDALQAAVHGLGVTLARGRIVEPFLQERKLVRLPGPAMRAKYGYFAVYPSHRRPSLTVARFIEWLQAESAAEMMT